MQRALTAKAGTTQEQVSNVSREVEPLRKNQKEMLEI